ncbi:hypothetical protein [Aliiglaciecola lipolytica]|uniref:Uncharacterized protein n=1 Tax=Aliiglaciecola lipolytica E3 TaxID=1127673 RepID=K6Y8T2_9ALTE|nr:hypothetical protein [Aliiglaciecola lipolytica]GAC13068.1 hypothetical protein GLIP_0421 [Aliiglaciecola lipolytica E3]
MGNTNPLHSHKPFISTLTTGVVAVLFWGGLATLIIGILIGQLSFNGAIIISDFLVKGSSAILGAGVFASIMKSAQFTSIFQQQVFEVFNDPKKLSEIVDVPKRWSVLTCSRLKDVLPDIYDMAAEKLNEAFFDDELEYHFEDYDHSYDIHVGKDGFITIMNTFDANIVINPKIDECTFLQNFSTFLEGEAITIEDLELENVHQSNKDSLFTKNKDNVYSLSVPIDKNKAKVRIRRTIRYKQSLSTEPYINVSISRYVKGAIVSARINNGYKLRLVKSGLGVFTESIKEGLRAEGYQTWTLAKQGDLLLPGFGYILVITSE